MSAPSSPSPLLPMLSSPSSSGSSFDCVFRRRLRALGHFDPDSFDSNDRGKFRQAVVWIEDQRVRHLDVDARDAIRDIDAEGWDQEWERYLKSLGCDLETNRGRKMQLMWLTARAIQLHYAENVDAVKEAKEKMSKEATSSSDNNGQSDPKKQRGINRDDPFDGVDVGGAEFRSSVSALASRLKIPEHPSEPLTTLHACCLYLNRQGDKDGQQQQQRKKWKESTQKVNLDEHSMGVPDSLKADKALGQALKILRLLHIQDLRTLQDDVNATIESVQKLTADPKTDTRLGKVGR